MIHPKLRSVSAKVDDYLRHTNFVHFKSLFFLKEHCIKRETKDNLAELSVESDEDDAFLSEMEDNDYEEKYNNVE